MVKQVNKDQDQEQESITSLTFSIINSASSKPASTKKDRNMLPRAGVFAIFENKLVLIKSSTTKCFVLPGGKIEEDETQKQAALREALEEAGIEGTIDDIPFYSKDNRTYFKMNVTKILDNYPEMSRERIFVDLEKINFEIIIEFHKEVIELGLKTI